MKNRRKGERFMYCTNCGNKLKENDIYCTSCGKRKNQEKNFSKKTSSPEQESLALFLGIFSFVFLNIPIVAIPLALTSIIISFTSKNKKNATTGRILGIISLIISVLFIIVPIIFSFLTTNILDEIIKEETIIEQYDTDNPSNTSFDISGYSWSVDDASVIYLNRDKTYQWYQNDMNKKDDYKQGKYWIYTGEEAIYNITDNLKRFGITEEQQWSLFQNGTYQLKDYYLMILSVDKVITKENETSPSQSFLYYYGFYQEQDKTLTMINMDTTKPVTFILKEKIVQIDI